MPYGIKIWNADGDVRLDLDYRVANLVACWIVKGNDSPTYTIEPIEGHDTFEVGLAMHASYPPHKVTRNGTDIEVTDGYATEEYTTQVMVFMYT